jgi:NAD-dependent DNA ligase
LTTPLNKDGQPSNANFNSHRRLARGVQELIGFLRGILADGEINEKEAEQLASWIVANREIANEWPVNVLANRLSEIYTDGIADDEERAHLAELVYEIVGEQDDQGILAPTTLPLTIPLPEVVFDRNEFVITGKFLYGTRKACEKEIEIRGGQCTENVRLQTNYLVIGSLVSRDWKFSSHGNKILKAIEYADKCSISIISERHWESFLRDGASRSSDLGS